MEKGPTHFNKIIRGIKDVKIQGANDIAINGIRAFSILSDDVSVKKILNSRPTEPLLQNSIEILQKSKDKKSKSTELINYIEDSKRKIAHLGSKLIKNDMNIFSHCHSTSVIEILKYAKKCQRKNFVVYTLEVEPLLQGRKTARELAAAGIKVVVLPDLSAEEALKHCNLFLFGVDAFTRKGVFNKIGTSLLCSIAKENKIPAYTCGVSLKYAKKVKIESRRGREVWDERNKNITVVNSAFDFTKKKRITGVISELGILKYRAFIKQAKKTKDKLTL